MPEVRASLKSTLQVLLRDEAAIGRAAGTNPVSKVLQVCGGMRVRAQRTRSQPRTTRQRRPDKSQA